MTDEKLLSFDSLDESGRSLAIQPLLEEYYGKMGAPDPKKAAEDEIRHRSLELCEGNAEALDQNGLPKNRKLWRYIEERISRFLQLSGVKFEKYAKLEEGDMVVIRGQVEETMNRPASDRGMLEEVFNEEDEILGPYIKQLKEVFGEAGTTSDHLLHKKTKLPSGEYRKILQACFSVARDMVLVIGAENYDKVRMKIGRSLFQRYFAEELIRTPSHELAAMEHVENSKGFWNQLPRVWVEELMILSRNPELVQQISEAHGKSEKMNVRGHIEAFNKQKGKQKLKRQKLLQSDYFRQNIKKEDFTDLNFACEVLDANLQRYVPMVLYKERRDPESVRELESFLDGFFHGLPVERAKHALTNFCSVLSNCDEAFRSSHRDAVSIKSCLVSDTALASARASLKDAIRMENDFVPVRETDSSHTLIVRPGLSKTKSKYEPLLDAFTSSPPKVLCREVSKDEIESTLAQISELREEIQLALKMFKEAEARMKAGSPENYADRLYSQYAIIKYCLKVYQELRGQLSVISPE